MNKKLVAKELLKIAKCLIANKPPELMTPNEFAEYEKEYDKTQREKWLEGSKVTKQDMDKVVVDLEKDPRGAILDIRNSNLYYEINVKGKRVKKYSATERGQRGTGFYSAPKYISDSTPEQIMNWINERLVEQSKVGSYYPYDPEYGQVIPIWEAIEKHSPINAEAVAERQKQGYKIDLSNYVQEGDKYIYIQEQLNRNNERN